MDNRDIEPYYNMHKLIYILGIDALDYELVEKLNLNNLKQLEYDKIIVPIDEKGGYPLSPEVWSYFLIGKNISKGFEKSYNFTRYLVKLNRYLNVDFSKGFSRRIKNLYLKVFTSSLRFGKLKQNTFLDVTKSMEINVPFYSFDNKTFDVGHIFGIGELSLEETIKEIKVIYENRKKQILSEIKNIKEKDVVFAYMHTTDMLQHVSHLRISVIKKHYIDLDSYVSILKRKLEDNFNKVIFIIVSDHGFDFNIGNHSMKGFYSSNVKLIPKPEKITEFYGIILDLVNRSYGLSHS